MSIRDFVVSRSAKTNPKNAKNAEERNGRDKRNKIDDVNDFVVSHILGEECIYNEVSDDLMGVLSGGHGTQHGDRQNERGSTPFSLPGPKDIETRYSPHTFDIDDSVSKLMFVAIVDWVEINPYRVRSALRRARDMSGVLIWCTMIDFVDPDFLQDKN
jgi:hypothetical protein